MHQLHRFPSYYAHQIIAQHVEICLVEPVAKNSYADSRGNGGYSHSDQVPNGELDNTVTHHHEIHYAKHTYGAQEDCTIGQPLKLLALFTAKDALGLKERVESIDKELQKRFFARPEARILTSLPGMGPILGA
jgi:hypothetical protein